jgi:Tfp pilus assembly protein PilN
MQIAINLSSEPFRRDRPILFASTVTGILLAGVLMMLVSLAFLQRGQVSETRQAIDRLEGQLKATSVDQAKLEATLQRPENAEILNRVLFINSLLYRKGISWTKIFSDLEAVVPYNVRLISIRPQVNGQREILLEMWVGAQSQAPVIEMLKRMESSPLFGATAVHNSLPPAQTEPLFRYRVTVRYQQKL